MASSDRHLDTSLYHVQFDGESYYVEAPDFTRAIAAWKTYVKDLWGPDCDGTEEPESAALVHDGAVIGEP